MGIKLKVTAFIGLMLFSFAHADETNFNAVQGHLEFLGYKCEQNKDRIICKTEAASLNLAVFKRGAGFLLISTFKQKPEAQKNRAELNQLLNEMNQNSLASRYYADNDTVFLEAFQPGNYQKENFAVLLAQFQNDWEQNLRKLKDRIVRLMG